MLGNADKPMDTGTELGKCFSARVRLAASGPRLATGKPVPLPAKSRFHARSGRASGNCGEDTSRKRSDPLCRTDRTPCSTAGGAYVRNPTRPAGDVPLLLRSAAASAPLPRAPPLRGRHCCHTSLCRPLCVLCDCFLPVFCPKYPECECGEYAKPRTGDGHPAGWFGCGTCGEDVGVAYGACSPCFQGILGADLPLSGLVHLRLPRRIRVGSGS
jgi:hypothetical protein